MAQPLTVVIFGASGDLTWRKLIPALFNLSQKGKLPPEARIVGVARTPYSDDDYRKECEEAIRRFSRRPVMTMAMTVCLSARFEVLAARATCCLALRRPAGREM